MQKLNQYVIFFFLKLKTLNHWNVYIIIIVIFFGCQCFIYCIFFINISYFYYFMLVYIIHSYEGHKPLKVSPVFLQCLLGLRHDNPPGGDRVLALSSAGYVTLCQVEKHPNDTHPAVSYHNLINHDL